MSGGHGHKSEPTVPIFHDRLGRGILLTTFLWIMFRAKENNGNMFGFNLPWLQPHEVHEHFKYVDSDELGKPPTLVEEEEHDEDEEEHEEEEEE